MDQTVMIGHLEDYDIEQAKNLLREYIEWINIDLSFQHISDELASFPSPYEPPDGAFIVAKDGSQVIGGVGMKRIGTDICEMKRLFVKDEYKAQRIGKRLIEAIIEEARLKGYKRMRLDTLEKMKKAQLLYRQFGFYEIEKYVENPIEGTVFMEKRL